MAICLSYLQLFCHVTQRRINRSRCMIYLLAFLLAMTKEWRTRLLRKPVCKTAKTSTPSKRQPTSTLWFVFSWITNPNFSENPVLKYRIKKVAITSQSFLCKFFNLIRIPDIHHVIYNPIQSLRRNLRRSGIKTQSVPCRHFFPSYSGHLVLP